MQPGETITPGAEQAPVPEQEKQEQPAVSVEQPIQPAEQSPPPASVETPEPQANWQFSADDGSQPAEAPMPAANVQPVRWTSSEYVAHNKGMAWFALLGLALCAAVGVIYVLTRDILAPAMVGVAGITFGTFAARPPRVLEYSVDGRGIQIGQKFYAYNDFKSFSLVEDGPLPAIMLLPLKRFLPPITVFYEPKEEETILDVLADYLPHEDKEPDLVDKLMRHIRF